MFHCCNITKNKRMAETHAATSFFFFFLYKANNFKIILRTYFLSLDPLHAVFAKIRFLRCVNGSARETEAERVKDSKRRFLFFLSLFPISYSTFMIVTYQYSGIPSNFSFTSLIFSSFLSLSLLFLRGSILINK